MAGFISLLVVAILVVVGVFVLITVVATAEMARMAKAELQYLDVDQGQGDPRIARTVHPGQWAGENDFEHVGYYLFRNGQSLIAAWRYADRPTWFCYYVIQVEAEGNTVTKEAVDFVTRFGDDISLTTGSMPDCHFLPPRPGAYVQSFSELSLDEQWGRHIEGENYLMDQGGAQLEPFEQPFDEALLTAVRQQLDYVRSIPLWYLHAPLWFFVRRSQYHNRSLEQLHQRGRIRLPNDMGPAGMSQLGQ